jgi:hypothetical protein
MVAEAAPYARCFLWLFCCTVRDPIYIMLHCKKAPTFTGNVLATSVIIRKTVDPLDQWDCVLEWSCRAFTGLPPHPPATWPGLWPFTVLREGGGPARSRKKPRKACDMWSPWLFTSPARSLVKHPLKGEAVSLSHRLCKAKWSTHWRVTKPVIESHRGHQFSKASLTGEPGAIVSVGASPGQVGSKRLTQWTSETVYWSEGAGPPQYITCYLHLLLGIIGDGSIPILSIDTIGHADRR